MCGEVAGDRWARADEAFALYDHGDMVVVGTEGWESSTPGNEWVRTVYIENTNPGVSSHALRFVVRFADGSAEVEEAYYSG